jgi:hypothetical protein
MLLNSNPCRSNVLRSVVCALVLLFSGRGVKAGSYSGGTGEPNDAYIIATAEDLNDIGNHPNDWDKHFRMTADINMAGYAYTTALIAPDTDSASWYFDGTPFTGDFNGSNHTIHNITINAASGNDDDLGYIGLFGQLRSSAVISNLRLENINVTCGANSYSFYVGALSGSSGDCDRHYAGGTILNCYSNGQVACGNRSFSIGGMVGCNYYGSISNCYGAGSVSANDYIGGMLGWNFYGDINNCHTNGDVVGIENSHAVGGVVGYNEYGNINNCDSNSLVSGGDSSYAVGGVVGQQDEGTISNCYAIGSVNADGAIGNLVGKNSYGSIGNCYSTGTVTGQSYPIGGLVGYNYNGSITNCYAADTVGGEDNSALLGGLVGWNYGTITNCYAAGDVTGGISSNFIGGLAGKNQLTITNCYATGMVSSGTGSSNLAGFCGYQNGYYAEISNCFWDTESTGMSIGYNLDSTYPGTITNVFGKTTAQMQDANTYIDAGWDFNTPVWKFCGLPDYPKLAWQACPGPEAPILASEPNTTIGTSNMIWWGAVAEANDYYAECAKDVNFSGVVYDSGWIADTNYTFYGLEVGQQYWYRVKAKDASGMESDWSNVESSLQVSLGDAVGMALDANSLENANMEDALLNKIAAVEKMLEDAQYEEAMSKAGSGGSEKVNNLYQGALNKLENDILGKTDGCAETGEPDKNDWLITCEAQSEVYPLIVETIEYVRSLTQ